MSSVRFSRSFSSHLFGLVSFDNMLIFGHRYSPKSLASLDPLTPPAAGLAGVENRSVPPSRSRSLSGEGRREAAREDAADADHMGVADPERIDPSGVPPPSLPSRIPVADRAHMSCRPTAVSLKITAAHPTRAQRQRNRRATGKGVYLGASGAPWSAAFVRATPATGVASSAQAA